MYVHSYPAVIALGKYIKSPLEASQTLWPRGVLEDVLGPRSIEEIRGQTLGNAHNAIELERLNTALSRV